MPWMPDAAERGEPLAAYCPDPNGTYDDLTE